MTAASLPDGTLAGYRLGSGSRADVYLATGSTGSVALKVFRPETSRDSIGAELDALGRVESPPLPQLLGIGGGPGRHAHPDPRAERAGDGVRPARRARIHRVW